MKTRTPSGLLPTKAQPSASPLALHSNPTHCYIYNDFQNEQYQLSPDSHADSLAVGPSSHLCLILSDGCPAAKTDKLYYCCWQHLPLKHPRLGSCPHELIKVLLFREDTNQGDRIKPFSFMQKSKLSTKICL